MVGQEQQGYRSQEEEPELADLPSQVLPGDRTQIDEQTEGLDDLLDEIDGVLETNAEEFVRGFVQKGGQ